MIFGWRWTSALIFLNILFLCEAISEAHCKKHLKSKDHYSKSDCFFDMNNVTTQEGLLVQYCYGGLEKGIRMIGNQYATDLTINLTQNGHLCAEKFEYSDQPSLNTVIILINNTNLQNIYIVGAYKNLSEIEPPDLKLPGLGGFAQELITGITGSSKAGLVVGGLVNAAVDFFVSIFTGPRPPPPPPTTPLPPPPAVVNYNVYGNNKLSRLSLDVMNQTKVNSSSTIQHFGECVFYSPLPNIMELATCLILLTPVTMNENTTGTKFMYFELRYFFTKLTIVNTELKGISVNIKNQTQYIETYYLTQLPKFDELIIMGNQYMCIPHDVWEDLLILYAMEPGDLVSFPNEKSVKIENNGENGECKISCTIYEAWVRDHDNCNYWDTDLIIDCSNKPKSDFAVKPDSILGIGRNKNLELRKRLIFKHCLAEEINKFMDVKRIKNLIDVEVTVENPLDMVNLRIITEVPKRYHIVTEKEVEIFQVATVQHYISTASFSKAEKLKKGECIFPNPANDVYNCEKIIGDLNIMRDATVKPSIKEITGCLILHKTHLNSYEFLTNIEKASKKCAWDHWEYEPENLYYNTTKKKDEFIENNTCIPYDIRRRLHPAMDAAKAFNNYERCGQAGCVFFAPVKGYSKCTIFDGDLIVTDETIEILSEATLVTGCINIVGSPMSNFDFLRTIKSFNQTCTFSDKTNVNNTEIRDNLCIPYSVRNYMVNPILKTMTFEGNNTSECYECDGTTIEELNEGCEVIIGDLVVKGVTEENKRKMEKVLATIREIYGRLIMKENTAIKIKFHNLQLIRANSNSEAALEITDNTELMSVDTPDLEKIISMSGIKVLIDRNTIWKPSHAFVRQLRDATGDDCTENAKSSCYMSVPKRSEEEEVQEAEYIDEGVPPGTIVAIVLSLGLVVLILAGIVVAVVIVWKKKSKEEKKNKEENNPLISQNRKANKKMRSKNISKINATGEKSTITKGIDLNASIKIIGTQNE